MGGNLPDEARADRGAPPGAPPDRVTFGVGGGIGVTAARRGSALVRTTEETHMAQVENIGEWKGSDIVDQDGEKIGRLEETYSELGRSEPIIGAVKTGRLSRGLHLVPLGDATVGKGHIRLPLTEDEVTAAPTVHKSGQMTPEEETAFLQHYGLPAPDDQGQPGVPRYESATVAEERRHTFDEQIAEADDLESQAAEHGSRAETAEKEAAEASDRASAARREESALVARAREIRDRVAASRPPA